VSARTSPTGIEGLTDGAITVYDITMSLAGVKVWFGANRRTLLITISVTALAFVVLALLLGLDDVMRTGFGALALAATLPFAIVIAIVLFCAILFLPFILLGALLDDATDVPDTGIGDGAGEIVAGYYGWVGKQRSPVFWGIPIGAAVGIGVLALVAYIRDAPLRAEERERARLAAETQQIMERTRDAVEAHYGREQVYPERIDEVLDAYGRPLAYAVVESRTKSSFTLTSQGASATDRRDDVCVDGSHAHDESKLVGKIVRRVVFGKEPAPVKCQRQ
jgi:hypothetical protein